MNRVIASDAPAQSFSPPFKFKVTKAQEVEENQPPLGTKFKSYQLNQAANYWTLDPFQYNITKFQYNQQVILQNKDGLVYKDTNFEKLLPTFTQTKKSVNDFRAQDYHRFEANDGYFNPKESTNNSDLWYYGAANNAQTNGSGIAGAPLNLQETKHIIFPESQRGGLDSKNLAKYSWEGSNNDKTCQFFNYNSGYSTDRTKQPFENVYNFDSGYCRNIGISGPYEGSMPFNPNKIS